MLRSKQQYDATHGTRVQRPTEEQQLLTVNAYQRNMGHRARPGWHPNKHAKIPQRMDVKNKNYMYTDTLVTEPGKSHAADIMEVYGRTVNPGLNPADVFNSVPYVAVHTFSMN